MRHWRKILARNQKNVLKHLPSSTLLASTQRAGRVNENRPLQYAYIETSSPCPRRVIVQRRRFKIRRKVHRGQKSTNLGESETCIRVCVHRTFERSYTYNTEMRFHYANITHSIVINKAT